MGADLVMPAKRPQEILDLAFFLESLGRSTVELSSRSALPRSLVLPPAYVEPWLHLLGAMRAQAAEAAARGDELVEVRVRRSPAMAGMIRWAEPRTEMWGALAGAGLVQRDWEPAHKLFAEVFRAALDQLDER